MKSRQVLVCAEDGIWHFYEQMYLLGMPLVIGDQGVLGIERAAY
ncbi:hypothetical protein [Xylella taiwanensis]|uniref:Uncharacterized protein n=1 Tax=Xylella taiwanensis TaxID=1444770 RepID=Z9JGX1_9GAMM|nr:hypothetical protein [Xylella taiwanensis]EWS77424.1 hypothetical protein AF72_10780 [Xylella taiwanensis]